MTITKEYFNSIKVRLESRAANWFLDPKRNFNSIKVRLESSP